MMNKTNMLCARTGVAAIAAVMALSPIHAAPKPIVDLSKSPALSGKPAAPTATKPAKAKPMIGPFDERTAELGGGAIVLLAIGMGAFALSRRRNEVDEWEPEAVVDEPRDPLFDEPMFQPTESVASAFAWGNSSDVEDQKATGETWIERAYRGPTPDNPSHSLKARLKRAAFFDKRERDAAAGRATPVEADAGLPEAMTDEREAA